MLDQFEPARTSGKLVSARKGVTDLRIEVSGLLSLSDPDTIDNDSILDGAGNPLGGLGGPGT